MNGPDHFRKAEALLCEAEAVSHTVVATGLEQRATVHAILAVAAAVATNDRLEGMSVDQLAEWLSVLGDVQAVRSG